jgi:hypothetical protein
VPRRMRRNHAGRRLDARARRDRSRRPGRIRRRVATSLCRSRRRGCETVGCRRRSGECGPISAAFPRRRRRAPDDRSRRAHAVPAAASDIAVALSAAARRGPSAGAAGAMLLRRAETQTSRHAGAATLSWDRDVWRQSPDSRRRRRDNRRHGDELLQPGGARRRADQSLRTTQVVIERCPCTTVVFSGSSSRPPSRRVWAISRASSTR